MRTILKLLLNLLHHCFYFMFWFFDCEACGIFTPWPGVEPISPALEGDALTTGPTREVPGISFSYFLYHITGGRRTLCVRVCVCVCVCVIESLQSCLTLCDPVDFAHQAPRQWDSPGKDPGAVWHFLLQGIFPTQGFADGFFTTEQPGSPLYICMCIYT